jgi:hypothetical protein
MDDASKVVFNKSTAEERLKEERLKKAVSSSREAKASALAPLFSPRALTLTSFDLLVPHQCAHIILRVLARQIENPENLSRRRCCYYGG